MKTDLRKILLLVCLASVANGCQMALKPDAFISGQYPTFSKSKNSLSADEKVFGEFPDEEVCKQVFVHDGRQHSFEQEAIRRNLTCRKKINSTIDDATESGHKKKLAAEPNHKSRAKVERFSLTTDALADEAIVHGDSKTQTSSGMQENVTSSTSSTTEPANQSNTSSSSTTEAANQSNTPSSPSSPASSENLCRRVKMKEFAAVKRALLKGIRCN